MQTLPITSSRSLRNLYFTRTLFQSFWAAAVISTAPSQPRLAAILLILYPLWDVACTLYDFKISAQAGLARISQIINVGLGVTTALGIAETVFDQPAYAIAIFGGLGIGGRSAPTAGRSDSTHPVGRTMGNDSERCTIECGGYRICAW